MTKYTKEIFSDPEKLRQKLQIYLQTPNKVELYAKAAELFFNGGGKEKLAKIPTFSWWAFFAHALFFMYRRDYVNMIICFFVPILPFMLPNWWEHIWIFCLPYTIFLFYAVFAKYIIISNFEKALRYEDDQMLKNMGGVNKIAVFIGLAILAVFLFLAVVAIINGQ
ncbi:MAG: hypothetical protein K5978_03600 [Campylobacter sp.]|nr:hypothetical protein [Campylobacter sp.]